MSESSFRAGIRSSVRGYWSGALSRSDFTGALTSALKRNLVNAWQEGSLDCGIDATELTNDELKARDAFIKEQQGYIGGFADAIHDNSKVAKGKLQALFDRAELWINRYADARNQAKVMTCENQKLTWVIGPTETHCPDCAGYSGKTYRASAWAKAGARPQSQSLACHGFLCRCTLQVTTKRASRGQPASPTG